MDYFNNFNLYKNKYYIFYFVLLIKPTKLSKYGDNNKKNNFILRSSFSIFSNFSKDLHIRQSKITIISTKISIIPNFKLSKQFLNIFFVFHEVNWLLTTYQFGSQILEQLVYGSFHNNRLSYIFIFLIPTEKRFSVNF